MSNIADAAIPGTSVELVVFEPWELASTHAQKGSASGTIVHREVQDNGAVQWAIAVRLEDPLKWSGRVYRFVIFQPKDAGDLEPHTGGFPIDGVYIGVRAEGEEALRSPGLIRLCEDWRGGLAGRAQLQLGRER